MAEHIIRRVRERKAKATQGVVLEAAAEFTRPLIGSSAVTIIIFAPLAFLSGVTGAFFKALSLTMAASLIISFLIAWIALPVLSTRLLSAKDAQFDDSGRLTRITHSLYRRFMSGLLRTPILVVLVIRRLSLLVFWRSRMSSPASCPSWMKVDLILTTGRLPEHHMDLKNLLLPAPDGHLFPLGRVAGFDTLSGQPQIKREDSRRMVAITARISGRDLLVVLPCLLALFRHRPPGAPRNIGAAPERATSGR